MPQKGVQVGASGRSFYRSRQCSLKNKMHTPRARVDLESNELRHDARGTEHGCFLPQERCHFRLELRQPWSTYTVRILLLNIVQIRNLAVRTTQLYTRNAKERSQVFD